MDLNAGASQTRNNAGEKASELPMENGVKIRNAETSWDRNN